MGRGMPVLLEVNVSGEAAKHGFASAEVEPLLPQLSELNNIEIRGLMCIAGLEGGDATARRDFAGCGCCATACRATALPRSASTSFRWA